MATATTQITDEQLLTEALAHFGLDRKDLERHRERVWSVAEGQVMIQTALGPLRYRAGDFEQVPCEAGEHTYPRWFGACLQCAQRRKHAPDAAVSLAARELAERIMMQLGQRKVRVDAAKTGAAPGPRRSTWSGSDSWLRRD